jgi:hypothetical protein
MTAKISKTNSDLAFLNGRLDEVHLSAYDRVRAKAQLARAEAFADAIALVWGGIGRLFQGSDKSAGRTAAPSAG